MKKFIITISLSLSLLASGCVLYAANIITPSYNQESFSNTDDEDQYLGEVNLCNPDGATCYKGYAYKDSDNGRIYVKYPSNSGSPFYAQKSNDSRWDYMIRDGNNWLYFSF